MGIADWLPTVNDRVGARRHTNDHRARGPRRRKLTMTNETLERNVTDELLWDPKIDSEAIAVSADNGIVTLHGTVGSFRQKREAKRAAERVYGVTNVNNALAVRILTKRRREDAEIRGDVLQALMLDALVPTIIDAMVKDGIVTLTGTAEWRY
jgi:osmotically-inducible protein OsmY